MPSPVTLTSFEQLIAEAAVPREVVFPFNGKNFSVQIRALTDAEFAAANAITEKVTPPKVFVERRNAMGAAEKEQTFDFTDAEFRAKIAAADRLRRAHLIALGTVGMEVPGSSLEEKATFLEKQLPVNILKLLAGQIEDLCAGDIRVLDLANFTTGSELTAAPN